MRLLTYILVGGGAAIAVIALAVVLLNDGEPKTVAPQADDGQGASRRSCPVLGRNCVKRVLTRAPRSRDCQ